MNENLAYHGRRLKRNGFIHSCFTRDGTVHIKRAEVYHLNFFYKQFLGFDEKPMFRIPKHILVSEAI